MTDSILISIKKLLGIDAEYTHFDSDLIMHINSVLMILRQMGVGRNEPFQIYGASEGWYDFLEDDESLEAIKSYIHMKVKLMFDPPSSSFVLEAMNKMISELEWRLFVECDNRREKEGNYE